MRDQRSDDERDERDMRSDGEIEQQLPILDDVSILLETIS